MAEKIKDNNMPTPEKKHSLIVVWGETNTQICSPADLIHDMDIHDIDGALDATTHYEFNTIDEKEAFIMGAQSAMGWGSFEITGPKTIATAKTIQLMFRYPMLLKSWIEKMPRKEDDGEPLRTIHILGLKLDQTTSRDHTIRRIAELMYKIYDEEDLFEQFTIFYNETLD